MSRVAGLPNTNSQRAFDMLMKTQFVMHVREEESGVVFATGTPVSNSMAEMWVMQHYLQPSTLARAGVGQFDAWASNFGEVVTAIELAPDGSSYRMNARFARFVNLPELTGMFSEVADIRTADMLDLPVPQQDRETIVAKPSASLKAYVESLVERSEAIHAGWVRPQEDNMLKVTNDGRLAALDMRLVDSTEERNPEGKVALCADKVLAIWNLTREVHGTQLVFSDLSTPKAHSFSVYGDIKAALLRGGVPESEIAFMQDYETDKAKARLFADVREGTVRVLLGSTERMGMGTNVQTRLVALHHLDAPWRPADVEQREGRIVRQGNANERVRLYRYVTEQSFDAYMWQTLETKAKFIAQVMSGDRAMRTAEDVALAALSYAEVKALASGNPLVLEKAAVDAEVAKLSVLKTQFEREQWSHRRMLARLPEAIVADKARLAKLEADAARATRALASGVLIVGDREIADRKEQAATLALKRAQATKAVYATKRSVDAGQFGEFTLSMRASLLNGGEVYLTANGAMLYDRMVPATGSYILSGLSALLGDIQGKAEAAARDIARSETLVETLSRSTGAVFPQAARLKEMLVKQTEVNQALGIFDKDASGMEDESGALEQAA